MFGVGGVILLIKISKFNLSYAYTLLFFSSKSNLFLSVMIQFNSFV